MVALSCVLFFGVLVRGLRLGGSAGLFAFALATSSFFSLGNDTLHSISFWVVVGLSVSGALQGWRLLGNSGEKKLRTLSKLKERFGTISLKKLDTEP